MESQRLPQSGCLHVSLHT